MKKRWIFALAVGSFIQAEASAESIKGRVVYVDDGDTVVLLDSFNTQRKIRLANIDAPESSHTNKDSGRLGQPFSEASKTSLSKLLKGKMVAAECYESDRYGRLVCEISVDGFSANAEQVRSGMAWANQSNGGRYLRDKSILTLQQEAMSEKRGIWSGKRQIPPWEWRNLCWKKGVCSS